MPRHMRAVGGGSAATVLFGAAMSFPASVAPMAFQRLACPQGEYAMAAAAQVLRRLRDEFEVTMALCGCATVGEITAGRLTVFGRG